MKLLGLLILAATAVLSNAMIQGTPSSHVPYSITVNASNSTASRTGGGAIITTRYLLTSASMVIGFTSFSLAWGTNRNETGLQPTQATACTENYEMTNYNGNHFNDIGIIRTREAVFRFSSTVQPIQLPRYVTRENEQGMIVGFGGAPNAPAGRLFAAFPRLTTGTRCLARWSNANLASQFCAEDERLRSDFCARNIGEPLTVLNRGVEEVVGIAIMPNCAGGASQPSLYANVFAHRAWILQQTGI